MANVAMTPCHRDVLRKARVYLMENMEIGTIIEHLIGELVLTPSDEDTLNAEKTTRAKTKALLEILLRKGDNGYIALMKVLHANQMFVYVHLQQMEREIDKQLRAPFCQTLQVQPAGPISQPGAPFQTLQVQPAGPISQPQSSPGPTRRSQIPTQSCHPTDQTSMTPLASMDHTDSGPNRSAATCTAASTSYQISCQDTSHQDIDSDMLPRSPHALVTQQALSTLASKMGAEWEQLAIHMGFQQNKLFHWKQESPTVWGQVFAMLNSWKNKNANNATISQLLAVLLRFEPPIDPSVYRHLYFQ